MRNIILTLTSLLIYSGAFAQDLSQLYEKVNPAVVTIYTEQSERKSNGRLLVKVASPSLGSGFLISEREVITAAHVVNLAERVSVAFADGTSSPAKVIAVHENADVAVIRLIIPKINAVTVPWGNSDDLKIGQRVFIVGAPLGLKHSLSSGYVSGFVKTDPTINPFAISEYVQTDAAINKGNSGGPMFNLKGEVVGVVSHIKTQSGGFEGIGFAATSNITQKLLLGSPPVWSGMDSFPLMYDVAKLFNLPQEYGILVQRLTTNSPLRSMGLKDGTIELFVNKTKLLGGGDIILAINGVKVDLSEKGLKILASVVQDIGVNNKLELKILRGGQVITLKR